MRESFWILIKSKLPKKIKVIPYLRLLLQLNSRNLPGLLGGTPSSEKSSVEV
jgi:hypothetical protein